MSFVNANEDERSGGEQGSHTKTGGQGNSGGIDPAPQKQGKPRGTTGRTNGSDEGHRSDEEVPRGQERHAQERLAGTAEREPREPKTGDTGASDGSQLEREGGRDR